MSIEKIGERMAIVTSETRLIELLNSYVTQFYVKDLNMAVWIGGRSIEVVDLDNAQKTGKVCEGKNYNIGTEYEENTHVFVCKVCNSYGNEVWHLLAALKEQAFTGLTVYERNKKGINTFSPFYIQKPIKEPTTWRKSHVIKALLSGQLANVTGAGRYTDDYAHDAHCNFGIGTAYNALEYAKQLIEDNSKGYYFSSKKQDDGTTQVAISLYTFDYKTATFTA